MPDPLIWSALVPDPTPIHTEYLHRTSPRTYTVVELCSALGWDLDLPRLSSYVSHARPVRSGPYYQFPESREPGSHGRPAGQTVFRF